MYPEERETIIRFDDSSDKATLYTCNRSWMTKMDRLASKSTIIVIEKEDKWSKQYTFPKKMVKVNLPPIITEESRAKMALRAKEMFARRKQLKGEQENGTDE